MSSAEILLKIIFVKNVYEVCMTGCVESRAFGQEVSLACSGCQGKVLVQCYCAQEGVTYAICHKCPLHME